MHRSSQLLVAIGLLFHSASWAQVDRANVSGTITDSSAAVIAEVSVTIESAETGFRRSTVSNGLGAYLLLALPVGTYTLSVGKAGFQPKKYDKLALAVGQTRTLNVTLDISGTAAQIDVTAEADALVQNNAEIGLVVDRRQVQSLPMNGRNWSGFLMLAPGATNTGDGTQNSVRFNGRGRDENNFTFDGVDATGVKDPRQEANLRLSISLDSIAEFRVSSGLYNAESGNGAGAQMNLVSKSGTNRFHGSAFEFFRNDKLDARRPIDSTGKPPFRLNQFGANVGGPVFKDKTFFFANFEGLRQRLAVTNNGTVPSEAYKARAIAASPAIRPVMDAYKPGTARGADANIDQLVTVGAQPWEENSGLIKVDHRFTPATSLFVRYNIDNGLIDEVRNALLETRTSQFRTQNGIIQFQHLFGPTLLTETRLGVNRSALHRDTNGTFPEGVTISGFTNLQADRGEVEIGTSYGWIQSLTWNKGRHTYKFGGEYRKIDLVLADTGTVTTSFTNRDNFVANKADSVSFASAQPGLKGLRPYYFAYAQDEIKVTPTLTLSLGTRYEYYSVAKTADGRGRVLDLERCGGFCPAGTAWYFPDKNNFAPRAGLGWAPQRFGGKTVLRAGYGIFYAPGQIDDVNAPIDSYPETYTLSTRDNPGLAFPATQFLTQAKSTGVSARAQQRDRRDAYAQQWTLSVQQLYSHNISDNSGSGDGLNIMISDCRRCDRGDADWDVRHTFTANGIYQLPLGRGRKYAAQGFTGRLLEGWNLSGLGMSRTGLPFNVTVNRSTADLPDGVVTTPGKAAPPQRPDVVAGQSLYAANPSATGWLNAAAFKTPVKGTWGSLPRSALRGPGMWQMDIAAGKTTRIAERHELEFRAELFNLFNRAQYGAPNASLSNLTTFGTITSVVNTSPTGFGGPRQIQLMLRYNFCRKANRERPIIGDRRKPSSLGGIQLGRWLVEYTTELINVLNVLGWLVDLEPVQAALLERVCAGPTIPAEELRAAGAFEVPSQPKRTAPTPPGAGLFDAPDM